MFAGGAAPGITYQEVYKTLSQSSAEVRSQNYMEVIEALKTAVPGFHSVVSTGGRKVTYPQIKSDIKKFESLGGNAAIAMQALSNIT